MAHIKQPMKVKTTKPSVTSSSQVKNPLLQSENDINEIRNIQLNIDNYNFKQCFEIDPYFENSKLVGRNIVIRLFRENFVKVIWERKNGLPLYEAFIKQVLANPTAYEHQNTFVDNPLPYVFMGVVQAVGDDVEPCFTPGTLVSTINFDLQKSRYYLDAQSIDIIHSPTHGWDTSNFQGYFRVDKSLITTIHTNPEYVMVSPLTKKPIPIGKTDEELNAMFK